MTTFAIDLPDFGEDEPCPQCGGEIAEWCAFCVPHSEEGDYAWCYKCDCRIEECECD